MAEWFEITNEAQIISPALLFYPERIKQNIQQMIIIAGSADRLRPHVKTYKCQEVVQMQLDAGISKFKCATLAEAEMLAQANVQDVLVSYALIGPAQKGFLKLCEKYPQTTFSVLADHPSQLNQWKQNASSHINIFIDIDSGLERTGIKPREAFPLFDQIQKGPFELKGIQVYDGNIVSSEPESRKREIDESFEDANELIREIESKLGKKFEVVCGGSITFPIHAQYPDRHLSPGTTLLWDYGYTTKFPDVPFLIAATVMTRVICKPGDNKICLDLGHKAIAPENDVRVFFPQVGDAQRIIHSEEHLVLEVKNADKFEIGQVLYGYPWHICPTVALHERAGVMENGRVNSFWNIVARKRYYQA